MDDRTAKAGEDMIEKEEVAPESDAKKMEASTGAIIQSDDMDEDNRQGEPEVELQEMPSSSTDRRFSTPDRKPAEKGQTNICGAQSNTFGAQSNTFGAPHTTFGARSNTFGA